tara:strand:- start:328 stop:612 length:285 start_codon:yes stop_codon:yes gene_type:complete
MNHSKIEKEHLEPTRLNLIIALHELMFYVSILPSSEETDAIRKIVRTYTSAFIKDLQGQGDQDKLEDINGWLTCTPPRPVRQAAEEAWQERMKV